MRILGIILLSLWHILSYAQDLEEQLENTISAVNTHYQTASPYSLIINIESCHYKEGVIIPSSKSIKKYKMVSGIDFTYMYLSTSQVFKDSSGELVLDNKRQLIEFNSFRGEIPEKPGDAMLIVAEEVNASVKEIKTSGNKTMLYFSTEDGRHNVEYEIVKNIIKKITYRILDENKKNLYTLITTYSDFNSNLPNANKYRINGHGRIQNDEFIPNQKYAEYEIFNY